MMLSAYRILQGEEKNKEGDQSSTQIISTQSGSQGQFGFVPNKAYQTELQETEVYQDRTSPIL